MVKKVTSVCTILSHAMNSDSVYKSLLSEGHKIAEVPNCYFSNF